MKMVHASSICDFKALRARANLKISDVSDISNTSRTTIYNLEGDKPIKLSKLIEILIALSEDKRCHAVKHELIKILSGLGLNVSKKKNSNITYINAINNYCELIFNSNYNLDLGEINVIRKIIDNLENYYTCQKKINDEADFSKEGEYKKKFERNSKYI